jgi:hypothetical protein
MSFSGLLLVIYGDSTSLTFRFFWLLLYADDPILALHLALVGLSLL